MSDENIDRDTHDHDMTYENEQSMVTIPLREYDKLKEQGNYKLPLIGVSFCKMKHNEHEMNDFIKFWENKVDMISIQTYVPPTPNIEKYKIYYATDQLNSEPINEFKCVQPFQRVVIKNQSIAPCCVSFNKNLIIGSIGKKDSIYNAWHSDKMNKIRELHKNGEFYLDKTCNDCVNLIYPNNI